MRRLWTVLVGLLVPLLLTSACAPAIAGSNENTVVVVAFSVDEALSIADQECARYGRSARLNYYDQDNWTYYFDCLPR